MKKYANTDNFCLSYYIVLLGLLIILTKPGRSYGEIMRLGYLTLICIPLVFNARFVPFAIACFYGICKNVFYSLIPDNLTYGILLVLGLIAIHLKQIRFSVSDIIIPVIFYLYCIVICLLYSDTKQNFINFGILSLLICPFIKSKYDIIIFALGICLMSAVLSVLYFINFDQYSFSVGEDDEFQRGTWQNMNSLSGAVSVGLPLSIALLLNIIEGEKPKWLTAFLVCNSVLITLALAMLSSRGSIISASVSTLSLIFLSKIKKKFKLMSLAAIFILVAALSTAGYFDLFLHRMTEESNTDTLGGRSTIWAEKTSQFFNDDALTQFFGMGRENCNNYGNGYKSTHNDFLTAMIGYGYVGLALFISFVAYPFLTTKRKNRITIMAFSSFYLLECMVLEPFHRGHFPIWMYYILILKIAHIYGNKEQKKARVEFHSVSKTKQNQETSITKSKSTT